MDIARVDPGYREDRVSDFDEVEQRLPAPEVAIQASRCMGCGIPFCHGAGCPLGNPIQEFNKAVGENRLRDAYFLLSQTSPFPEFTSRVCPALCEAACCVGINFDPSPSEISMKLSKTPLGADMSSLSKRASIRECALPSGSGPSGLAAAEALNKCGHEVVVFEKNVNFGGLLRYGIPDFKLKKSIIERRLEILRSSGILFEGGVEIGADISAEYLCRKFDALCLC
ncbi:MAG: NAD(P)-binding protein, partial [Bacilli bacterium]